ncbi:hypothetical protein JCM5296_000460 [Sporobolomyces johnsonii]
MPRSARQPSSDSSPGPPSPSPPASAPTRPLRSSHDRPQSQASAPPASDALSDLTAALERDPELAGALLKIVREVERGRRHVAEDDVRMASGDEDRPDQERGGRAEESTRRAATTRGREEDSRTERRRHTLHRLAQHAAARLTGKAPSRQHHHHRHPPSPIPPHSRSPSLPSPSHHRPKRPKPNVNFHFPSSWDASGLPRFSTPNPYLPARLQQASPSHSPHRRTDDWEQRFARPHRPYGDDANDDENILFPALLSLLLVIVPIMVLALMLGAIFKLAGVNA